MLHWVAQVGRLRTVREFGASCLQKAFERKWENRLLLLMLKIFSILFLKKVQPVSSKEFTY